MKAHVSWHGLARSALAVQLAALLLLSMCVSSVIAAPADVPTISALTPASATAGDTGFMLTVTGTNFIPTSVVRWNGANRTTAFVSATQLTAAITSSDLVAPGTANVTVFNAPPDGGGTSSPFPFVVNPPLNPVPSISGLIPASAEAGGTAFMLTVMGSNFIPTSVVRWNGSDRPTNFVSPTQLSAAIPALDITSPGSVTVRVFNPAPGGGISIPATFNINPPAITPPSLTALVPNSVAAGGPAFTLMVMGTNFNPSSEIRWNGSSRATNFMSSIQLMTQVPSSDIASPGVVTITVFNPGTGGGISNGLSFTITPPAQTLPVITSISPQNTAAGGPAFTLIVSGSNFVSSSTVKWNGADRLTTFISANQLTAAISASDISQPGTSMVTVFNPGPSGGNSAALAFTITAGPVTGQPPALTAIASSVVTQGAANVPLTLIGDNFRPGARVIVSDASADVLDSAKDILVQSSTLIDETTMSAMISVSPNASPGMKRVDVLNVDGSNTGPAGSRTSKLLRIETVSSLGAPLAVHSLVITHPRHATVIGAGEEVFAEAIIGGAGTGTVTGQWLWDGNVIEQISVNLTGGEPMRVKSTRSVPTRYLGSHRLELRIITPNILESSPLQIVINPGAWRSLRLIAPRSGAGFTPEASPLLRWTILPDAARYQVGLSRQPNVSTISQWHDVEDTQWQVPKEVWDVLPEGLLYWTVRVIGPTGEPRKPAPMRRIYRLKKGALQPTSQQPAPNAHERALLEWEGLNLQAVYRLVLSRDPDGKDIIRRFMTLQPRVNLRDIKKILDSTEIYYWTVEALSPSGHSILTGKPQSFIAGSSGNRLQPSFSPNGRESTKVSTLNSRTLNVLKARCCDPSSGASLRNADYRTKSTNDDFAKEVTLQIAGLDVLRDQPVRDSRPAIRLVSNTTPIPSDVAVMIDDTDVTALAKIDGRTLSFRPAIPLSSGAHQIAIRSEGQTLNWKFVVAPASADQSGDTATPGTDAENVDPQGSTSPETPNGAQYNIDAASNTQWTSGSEGDTNVITLGVQSSYKRGPWRLEMSGGGLLNNLLGPRPRKMLGRFNEYVFRVAHEEKHWGEHLRFGTIIPELYFGAEFMTVAIPKPSVEAGLRSRIGKLSFFTNVSDVRPVEAQGLALPDTTRGVSFEPRFPSERVKFRLMWLGARNRDERISIHTSQIPDQPFSFLGASMLSASDALGGLLTVTLGRAWNWTSEYVAVAIEGAPRSHAFRTVLAGALGKTTLSIAFRDVDKNYSSPGNLTPVATPDRRGFDASVMRPTSFGAFNFTYQFLQSDTRSTERPTTTLHTGTWNWSKSVTKSTAVTLAGNVARTFSGEPRTGHKTIGSNEEPVFLVPATHQSRIGISATLTQSLGQLMVTVGGSRNWARDEVNPGQNNINSMINLNGAWSPRTFFQLQSNISINWLAGDRLSVGQTRTFTTYIQPTFAWNRTGVQVIPLLTVTTQNGKLGSDTRMVDMLTTQYGARVAWRMPGRLQLSTLSVESNYSRVQDRLFGSSITTPRLLLVWTIVKPARSSGG